MNRRRALITGASGFIGSALARRLVEENWHVTAVGRDASRLPAGCDQAVVAQYDDATLASALEDRSCEVIFHLAAYGVAPDQRDPAQMFAANVAGTASLASLAARIGARAVIYAGSSAEYINAPPGMLIDEDYPLCTKAIYGASKAAGGLWGRALAAREGIVFQWLRLFGVYGPGEARHRLFPAIAAQLARDMPVDLSPGRQIRDILYIDEVIDALLLAADAAIKGEDGPFNLCSGRAVSVQDVALALADALGKPRELLRFGAIPYRPDENLWLVGDGRRLQNAAGFRSMLTLEQGIERFIANFIPLQGRPA